MNLDWIRVDDLKKAKIRYYEKDKNGCEIPEEETYTLFVKKGNKYINFFHPFEEYNVYERVPYSNFTSTGETFGSKLILAQGIEKDGICYIIENDLGMFEDRKFVTVYEIEKQIINDFNTFYYDRKYLLQEHKIENTGIIDRINIMKSDSEREHKFMQYIRSKSESTEEEKSLKR